MKNKKQKSAIEKKKPTINLQKDSQKDQEIKPNIASQSIIRELGRISAGAYYDHQQVRMQGTNRIRDIVRKKVEGISFNEVEEKKEDEDKHKEKFKDSEIPALLENLKKDDKITQREFNYINRMLEVQKKAEQYEKEYQKLMNEFVEQEPIYQKFLKQVRGISAILSANLIKEFGYCENAPHISSLWKYCGMAVENGQAPFRKKKEKLGFNIKLRTMVWKISDSFVKQRTPFYRDIYDKEKARQVKMLDEFLEGLSKEDLKKFDKLKKAKNDGTKRKKIREFVSKVNPKAPVSLMNADLRAKRKAVKIFLAHYWQCGKELTKQKIDNPYVESKLKHKHISNWRDALK